MNGNLCVNGTWSMVFGNAGNKNMCQALIGWVRRGSCGIFFWCVHSSAVTRSDFCGCIWAEYSLVWSVSSLVGVYLFVKLHCRIMHILCILLSCLVLIFFCFFKRMHLFYVVLLKLSTYFYTQVAILVNICRAEIETSFLSTTASSVPV